jgi:hypothetical protein
MSMGQSIDVLLYGVRVPEGLDIEELRETWEAHVACKVEDYEARLRARTHNSWGLARQAYVPNTPCPDDAEPDDIVGFYVCRGDNDSASSHRFPAMTFAEMRRMEPTAAIIKRCRRRWSRFARWARWQGVEFGKPRIWRTRTEVA